MHPQSHPTDFHADLSTKSSVPAGKAVSAQTSANQTTDPVRLAFFWLTSASGCASSCVFYYLLHRSSVTVTDLYPIQRSPTPSPDAPLSIVNFQPGRTTDDEYNAGPEIYHLDSKHPIPASSLHRHNSLGYRPPELAGRILVHIPFPVPGHPFVILPIGRHELLEVLDLGAAGCPSSPRCAFSRPVF